MSIYLIRHGETDGNRLRVVQVPGMPLNARGVAQAERLARRLEGAGVVRILTSDLTRAAMTADALARATGVSAEPEPLLQERNFGDFRGREYASFDFDPMGPDISPPGGESWEDFHERAAAAWRRVAEARAETEGSLAVVTHGLVCYSFALHHLHLAPPDEVPERWGNTAVTRIDGAPPWRVRLLNCIAHLDGDVVDDVSLPSGL